MTTEDIKRMHTLTELTEISRLAIEFSDITDRLHSARATGKPTESLQKEFDSTWQQLKKLMYKPIPVAHSELSHHTSDVAAQNRINAVKHEMD